MPKHHILCLHGVGKHSDKWVEDDGNQSFKHVFREQWDAYNKLKKKGFDENIHLESIHYDDRINKLFKSWKEQSENLKKFLEISPGAQDDFTWLTDAIDKASEAEGKDDRLYTHLMDLMLFWGSPTIQNDLVQYVGGQIIAYVNKVMSRPESSGEEISIIAHSMGTSMLHKVLQAMFNQKVNGETLSGDFKFNLIAQVSNISYVLSGDRENHYRAVTGPNETLVRPSVIPDKGVSLKMINANHEFDPAAKFLPFEPPLSTWLDTSTASLDWYRNITLTHFSSVNIHVINHYFRDPKLHVPFFELLLDISLPVAEKKKVALAFASSTPVAGFKNVKAQYKQLIDSDGKSFKAFYKSLMNFYKIIKLFKENSGGLT